jgi:hypothetical protein
MPIIKGFSKSIISDNIAELIKSGKKRDVAIAISLESARRSRAENFKKGRKKK